MKKNTMTFPAEVEMNGSLFDCEVHYRVLPAEPDVNFGGGVELEGVYYEDEGCILEDIPESEYERLMSEAEADLELKSREYECEERQSHFAARIARYRRW